MAEQENVISIGTVIKGGIKSLDYIDRFIPAGIESVQICFWNSIPSGIDEVWAGNLARGCMERKLKISALAFFADPFAGGEEAHDASEGWIKLLNLARAAGISLVTGFTGRVPGTAVAQSYEPVTRFFSPLLDTCEKYGIKLAFENCAMKGTRSSGAWNIAFLPEVWHELFDVRFNTDSLGLEFDPSHCIRAGLPTLHLLNKWEKHVFHVHGKDSAGIGEEDKFPGNGTLDWSEIFRILKSDCYSGSVDIEGYHDKFVSHDAEFENQKRCVRYLKNCRSGGAVYNSE